MKFTQVLLRAVLAAAAGALVLAGPTFGVRQAVPGSHGNLRDFARSMRRRRGTVTELPRR